MEACDVLIVGSGAADFFASVNAAKQNPKLNIEGVNGGFNYQNVLIDAYLAAQELSK